MTGPGNVRNGNNGNNGNNVAIGNNGINGNNGNVLKGNPGANPGEPARETP